MLKLIQPTSRHIPSGYTHGVLVPTNSNLLYISEQLASDQSGVIQRDSLVQQFLTCLDNVLLILQAADETAGPQAIVKLTIFITSFEDYRASKQEIAIVWNSRFGQYYPSISIIEVSELIDQTAKVEIEAVAVVSENT